jgi:hypothetical protein
MRKTRLTGIIGVLILCLLVLIGLSLPAAAGTDIAGSFIVRLTISDISAVRVGSTRISVSWLTNGGSTSQVFYDSVSHPDIEAYAFKTDFDPASTTRHNVQLINISSCHYRIKSTVSVNSTQLIAISDDHYISTYSGSGSSGPGNEETGLLLNLDGLSSPYLDLSSTGMAKYGIELTTTDGQVSLSIPAGTRILNSDGNPLELLSIKPAASIPPSDKQVITVYEFSPAGATFTPPVRLTIKYNPSDLVKGTPENALQIFLWDGTQWKVELSTVDTQNKTVSAGCSRCGLYALMVKIPTPTSSPTTSISTPVKPTHSFSQPTPSLTPSETQTPVSPPVKQTNWWLIGGIITAVSIIAIVFLFFSAYRKRW